MPLAEQAGSSLYRGMAERYGRPIDPTPQAPAPAPAYEPPDEEEIAAVPISMPASARQSTPSAERIGNEVQKAQEQLLTLRRQQEQIERQKRELEELSRRQDELEQGRTEMIEKLSRALVAVERQTGEAQKRVEQLHSTNEAFGSHLVALESINPKGWASADLQRELSRALGMVDHARTDYNQQKARFAADASKDNGAAEGSASGEQSSYAAMFGEQADHHFSYWLKAGVAFTLPLLVLGFLLLMVLCYIALGSGGSH